MSTNADFDNVIKRVTPYTMMVDTFKRKNYFWNKIKKEQGWKGGTIEIPIEGGEASSLRFGKLVRSNDISSGTYDLALCTSQPELWGALKFWEKDLERHDSLEESYLKLVPNKLNQFIERKSERVSMCLLGDGSIAALTANGEADGEITVDHPEHFTLKEKVVIDDSNSSPTEGYVVAINMETKKLTIHDARTGGSAIDLTGYTTAQGAKVYLPDEQSNGFLGLADYIFSATNGGSDSYFDKTKLSYPVLQAHQFSGSAWTKATILEDLFTVFYDTVQRGKGAAEEMLVPFHVFKAVASELQENRDYVTADKKAGYGFRSLNLIGPEGEMTITALRDMPATKSYILDWSCLEFRGDKFFERKRHLGGQEYHMERTEDGYVYIQDIKFYGQLIGRNLSRLGGVHSIPATLPAA
jgi:hypothetical protein